MRKKVVIIEDTQSESVNEELSEIENICTTLMSCHRQPRSMGFLKDPEHFRHELYGQPRMCISRDIVSVTSLLSREFKKSGIHRSLKLSRKDRKEISIQVTTALLLLYSTPWITSEWSGAEVVFENFDRTASSYNLRPYISRRFSAASKCSSNAVLSGKNTQETLFRLGILLLELCIGESLDEHCLDIGKARTRETEFDIVSEWWQREAGTAEGPEVAEIIRKCLFFKFQTDSKNLFDEDLRRAIYNEVVQPLREVPRNFNAE